MGVISCFGQALSTTPSIQNCGGDSDHMTNVVMQFSPDPFKGKATTLTISGDLDEDISAGEISIDLNVNILGGVQKASVNGTYPFALSDTLKLGKGATKLVVGPFKVPSVPLIHLAGITGTIQVHNPKSERVLCAQLQTYLGAESPSVEEAANSAGTKTSICSGPNAHLKNLNWTDDGENFTLIGDMDKDVSNFNVELDLVLKALVKFPALKFNIPVALTPGFKQGPIKLTVGPSSNGRSAGSNGVVSVNGTVMISDSNSEEIACINVAPEAAALVVV